MLNIFPPLLLQQSDISTASDVSTRSDDGQLGNKIAPIEVHVCFMLYAVTF